MKYMVDAHILDFAEEFRDNGIDCETVVKLINGDENSSIRISDPDIIDFLRKANGTITLITKDTELARYCQKFNIPCIRIQDIVMEFIKNRL